jgi:alpha-1,2-mannosyltransferase
MNSLPPASPNYSRTLALMLFGILLAGFVISGFGNALHKGGDFTVSLIAGKRFLDASPLYEGSSPGAGVTGPPFQSVWFAPFAALAAVHVGLSRILWYSANVVFWLAGVWCWTNAILPKRFSSARQLWSSSEVLLPLLAIALPSQTNFEHQNMNALLLFLTGAGAMAIVDRSNIKAGAFLGAAVALKAFPALMLAALFVHRLWRIAAIGCAFALGLTMLIVLRYGPAGSVQTLRDWLAISLNGGWPTRAQNQSLFAALYRSWPGDAALAHSVVWFVLIAVVAIVCWRRRNLPDSSTGAELAFVLAVAVVLSPISWEHYWVLLFPVLQTTYAGQPNRTALGRIAFWLALLLITGPSPLLVGETGYDMAREWSSSTIAAILLIGTITPALWRETASPIAP